MIRKKLTATLEHIDVTVTVSVDESVKLIKAELTKPGLPPLNILPYLDTIDADMLAEQVQLDLDI